MTKVKTGYLVYVHNELEYKQLLRFKQNLNVARHRLAVVDCVGNIVDKRKFMVVELPWTDILDNKNYTAYYVTPFEQTILISPGIILKEELMYADYTSVRYVDVESVPQKPEPLLEVEVNLDLFMFNKSETSAQFFHLLDLIRINWETEHMHMGLDHYYFHPDASATWVARFLEIDVICITGHRMNEYATHTGVHPIRGLQNVSMV
jgi:hypothetical protein